MRTSSRRSRVRKYQLQHTLKVAKVKLFAEENCRNSKLNRVVHVEVYYIKCSKVSFILHVSYRFLPEFSLFCSLVQVLFVFAMYCTYTKKQD